MVSVRVSLHAFFYKKSGEIFALDVNPQMTLKEVGITAIEAKGAWSNQTQRNCFEKFEIYFQGEFYNIEALKLSDMDTINGVFHVVNVDGFYNDALKKKFDSCPICVYFKGHRDMRLKDGFYPVYPKLTIKQMKFVIETMAHGSCGFKLNFWHNGELMENNSKQAKSVLNDGDVVVVSKVYENICEDPCGSPIMMPSKWKPTLDDFTIPPLELESEIEDDETSVGVSFSESDDGSDSAHGTVEEPEPEGILTLGDFIDFDELPSVEDLPDYDITTNLPQGYLQDGSDFTEVQHEPLPVRVKEPLGGRKLFDLQVVDRNVTINQVKFMICNKISKMPNANQKHQLGVDGFRLEHNGSKCADELLLSIVGTGKSSLDLVVVLRVRGGGKGVMSSITKPAKKSDIYKQKSLEIFKKIESQNYESSAMKDVQAFSKHIHNHTEHGNILFKEAVVALSADDAKKALKIIEAGGRNYGSTEDKLEKICQMMCSKMLGRLDAEQKKLDDIRNSVMCGMITAYTGWCYKSGKYDNSALKALLKEHLQKIEQQSKPMEGDADMSALTDLFSKSSI